MQSTLQKNFYTILGILAALVAVVSIMDADDELMELEQYCEMVQLHKSNPTTGWPDYKGIYLTACRR